jgi:hypothetical protein
MTGESADVAWLDRDDPEPLIPAGLAPARLAVDAGEEVGHGLGEVPQRLLLYHLAAAGQPTVLSAGIGQLRRLRTVGWRMAAAGPPPGLLLDGQVPHEPSVRAVLPQGDLLRWRWHQPVARHESNLLATTDSLEEVERRALSGLKARVSTPRI